MPLPSGTKLGPYEVQSPIGAGGMGEVYRAKDTRLDRTVAVKILPSHLSDNPDAKQRFDREARAISSLNHPNICTLHDVAIRMASTCWSWSFWRARHWPTAWQKVRSRPSKCCDSGLKSAKDWSERTRAAWCIAI